MTAIFSGVYGTLKCTDCGEPFARHEGPEKQCPRFSVPFRIRKLWASYGERLTPSPYLRCPCAKHSHS